MTLSQCQRGTGADDTGTEEYIPGAYYYVDEYTGEYYDYETYENDDVDIYDLFADGFGFRSLNMAELERRKRPKKPKKPKKPKRVKKPVKKRPNQRPMKIVLRKMTRQKAPKQFAWPEKVEKPNLLPKWTQNDVFYPKSLLRVMAENGVDISGFPPIQGRVGGDSRAIVSTATKWTEIDESDGKIVIPYTFQARDLKTTYLRYHFPN